MNRGLVNSLKIIVWWAGICCWEEGLSPYEKKTTMLTFVMLTSLEFRIYIDITCIQQTRYPSIKIAHENLGLAEVRISLAEK